MSAAPARRLGVRKIEKWVTADGREWPDAASAAEHQRLTRLREWFAAQLPLNLRDCADSLARAFDEEFAYSPRNPK